MYAAVIKHIHFLLIFLPGGPTKLRYIGLLHLRQMVTAGLGGLSHRELEDHGCKYRVNLEVLPGGGWVCAGQNLFDSSQKRRL